MHGSPGIPLRSQTTDGGYPHDENATRDARAHCDGRRGDRRRGKRVRVVRRQCGGDQQVGCVDVHRGGVEGSFNGKKIKYFDFDTIKLVAGNKVAPIWTVTGGAAGQDAIVGSVPGSPDYSALHKVSEVTWKSGATPRLLTSVQDVTAAAAAGDVTVTETERVINAPLLEFGQERHAGYAKGQTIHYYELGKVKVAPGNAVLPIWTFTNGVSEQTNIADTEPGTTAYPPLWEVVTATWKIGVTPRLITSFEDMKAAEAAGQLTLAETPDVVNCPFL